MNKTAVITGASRGIGRSAALKLAADGCQIAIIYAKDAEGAEQTRLAATDFGVKAHIYQCDVANFLQAKETCEKIAAEYNGVDILVNNAGITRDGLVMKMTEADFDAVIDTNLRGAFHFIRHLARFLMKSPAGRIINISSVSGIVGNPGQANYSASKAGLIGLTKTVAKELAPRRVTCNAVAPGLIETDMTEGLESLVSAIPLKRMGSPEEVAAVVSFLASDAAAYITGEIIRIDGGMCI